MKFVDVGYSYLAPLLLLMLTKNEERKYSKALLATANVSLIFFFIYSCFNYYDLYRWAQIFGMEISFKGLLRLASTNKIYAAKNILLLLLPLVFLFKKLSSNIVLTILMLVLIWWDVLTALIYSEGYLLPISQYKPIIWYALNYFSLLVGMYALLWLLKRLPFQFK